MSTRLVPPTAIAILRASVLALLFAAACAHPARRPFEPSPRALPVELTRIQTLQTEISRLVDQPATSHALWAVLVQSLDNGQVLFTTNASKLVMPASNMKIVTLAVAAERLGWDYRYETKLMIDAPVENGVLEGDLVIVGSGDPSISWRDDVAPRLLRSWADQVSAAGIRRIDGRIIGDGRAFDRVGLGMGWSWDDLADSYAAPVSGLEYNEGVGEVVFRPGTTVGAPVLIELPTPSGGLALRNFAVTGAAGSEGAINVVPNPGSGEIRVSGSLPLNGAEIRRRIPVAKPAEYFASALRDALVANAVEVAGPPVDIEDLPAPPELGANARVVASHTSPPFSELAKGLMKPSNNLFADTLLKTVGRASGQGSAKAGADVAAEVLERWGVPRGTYVMADGSGLSRYNYVSATMLVTILRAMQRDPRHATPFVDSLPVAGRDGTLANRMKGTKAEGNAKAKTGSFSNARALSGYVRTLDGELLVFSIIGNNFSTPPQTIEGTADLIVERLANFTRR